MGGAPADTPPRRRRREGGGSGDPCQIELEIDLVGIQPDVSGTLTAGAILTVELLSMPPVVSVVCRTGRGQVVGSLSAFMGLVQLIRCLDAGVRYEAAVLTASRTRCAVIVRPVSRA